MFLRMDNATFSEFLRDPNWVINKLKDSRSVVLERRDAPPLVLSLKSRQEEASFGSEVVPVSGTEWRLG